MNTLALCSWQISNFPFLWHGSCITFKQTKQFRPLGAIWRQNLVVLYWVSEMPELPFDFIIVVGTRWDGWNSTKHCSSPCHYGKSKKRRELTSWSLNAINSMSQSLWITRWSLVSYQLWNKWRNLNLFTHVSLQSITLWRLFCRFLCGNIAECIHWNYGHSSRCVWLNNLLSTMLCVTGHRMIFNSTDSISFNLSLRIPCNSFSTIQYPL